jgi:hypothetical protein
LLCRKNILSQKKYFQEVLRILMKRIEKTPENAAIFRRRRTEHDKNGRILYGAGKGVAVPLRGADGQHQRTPESVRAV